MTNFTSKAGHRGTASHSTNIYTDVLGSRSSLIGDRYYPYEGTNFGVLPEQIAYYRYAHQQQ